MCKGYSTAFCTVLQRQFLTLSNFAYTKFYGLPGETLAVTSSDFPLEVGETVTINAVYSPQSASVDFGLIAPDGLFYPFRAESGRFNETIKVGQRGSYTLAIRNNSSYDISVSGFVVY